MKAQSTRTLSKGEKWRKLLRIRAIHNPNLFQSEAGKAPAHTGFHRPAGAGRGGAVSGV